MIKNFFKGPADPTLGWPVACISTPEVDTAQKKIGPLVFGDDLQKASIFGRPTVTRSTDKNYLQLLYANEGFEIDFDNDSLAYAAFFLNHDDYSEWNDNICFSSPVIDKHCFKSASTVSDVRTILGSPDKYDDSDGEIILFYNVNQIAIEFEAYSDGVLKRINLYPA